MLEDLKHRVPENLKDGGYFQGEESLELDDSTILGEEFDEALYEMTKIVSSDVNSGKKKFLIAVDSDVDHCNIPYFKVYNCESWKQADSVASLHFKDSGIGYHTNRSREKSFSVWVIPPDMIKLIHDSLEEKIPGEDYTYWQYMCYQWNYSNNLIRAGIRNYLRGEYDKKYLQERDTSKRTAYVPSNQKIPNTWVNGPKQGEE